jgi:DNA polymerase epsilon subunit 2
MNDPGPGNILPRPKIPDFFTSKLITQFKNVVFTSNPCRIRYCTQEIVIFRENLLSRFQRNALVKPVSNEVDNDSRLHVNNLIWNGEANSL